METGSFANLYLDLVAQRDHIEQDQKITDLIKHSFDIQCQLLADQKEGQDQENIEHGDPKSFNVNDARTFMDL